MSMAQRDVSLRDLVVRDQLAKDANPARLILSEVSMIQSRALRDEKPTRPLAAALKDYNEIASLYSDIAARIQQNRQIAAEAEVKMTRPLQELHEVHRLAGLKSACDISIAADEPVLKDLYERQMDFEREINNTRRWAEKTLRHIQLLENRQYEDFDKPIAALEAQIAEIKELRRSHVGEPIERATALLKALIGEEIISKALDRK